MKRFLRKAAYTLTRKRVKEEKLDTVRIGLKSSELFCFNLSSNPIFSFTYEDRLYYFRECPVLRPGREYYLSAIDAFFDSLSRIGISKEHFKQEILIRLSFSAEEIRRFKEYVDAKKADKGFTKLLYSADELSYKYGFSIWEKQTYGASFFGAFGMGDLDEGLYDLGVYFLWCMRSAAIGYKLHGIARGKHHSFFNAVRSVATAIVAEELGLGNMVSDVRFCVLKLDDGRELFGALSKGAEGTRMADSSVLPEGSLQRELLSLNVLDVICRQVDHGPNNYNVSKKDGRYHVCAFDNDNQQTFFPFSSVKAALAGCAPLVNEKGEIARYCLDKQVVEKLQTVNLKALKKRLKPYLNLLQIRATVKRINKLKKAISKSKCLLLGENEFSSATAEAELNGGFGITYLSKALNKE